MPEFKTPLPETKNAAPDISSAFTTDEPPPTPPYLEPHLDDPPKAQQALASFFKKVFPGQPH